MPNNSSKKKHLSHAKVAKIKSMTSKQKNKWVIGLIIATILMVFAIIIYFITNGSGVSEQAKMVRYLEEKYGKEFIVKNYRIEGSGVGVEGDPIADAHPKDDESLRFEVADKGRFRQGRHAYSDGFVNVVWVKQQDPYWRAKLKDVLGYIPEYKLTVGFSGKLDTYRDIPSFEAAVKNFPGKVALGLYMHPSEDINAKTKQMHAERIVQIINLLKKEDVRGTFAYTSKDDERGIYLENAKLESTDSIEQVLGAIKE